MFLLKNKKDKNYNYIDKTRKTNLKSFLYFFYIQL